MSVHDHQHTISQPSIWTEMLLRYQLKYISAVGATATLFDPLFIIILGTFYAGFTVFLSWSLNLVIPGSSTDNVCYLFHLSTIEPTSASINVA